METQPTAGTILVATDLSAASDAAVDQAIALCKRMGAPLEILHVLELPAEIPFGPTFFDADAGNLYTRVNEALAKRVALASGAGVACQTKILEGSPAIEINKRGARDRRRPHRDRDARPDRARPRRARQRRRAGDPARVLSRPDRAISEESGLGDDMQTQPQPENNIAPNRQAEGARPGKGAATTMETKGRILVVDDEVNARTALAELLRDEGYVVETAADGFKALGQAGGLRARPRGHRSQDAGHGRHRAAREGARRAIRSCRVVVMTAFGAVETAVEAMRAGARDYLTKPVNVDELSLVVARELAARRLRDRGGAAARAAVREVQLRQHHRQRGADAGGVQGRRAGRALARHRAHHRRERHRQGADRRGHPRAQRRARAGRS